MLKTPKQASKYVLGKVSLDRPNDNILGIYMYPDKRESNQGIYVLQVDDEQFYIGKSNNIKARIEQHERKQGSPFIKKVIRRHNPRVKYIHDWESWERAETLFWMYKFGITNVRGWMYTDTVMGAEQKLHAFAQICEKYDLCRKCGNPGHFVSECVSKYRDAKKPLWFR